MDIKTARKAKGWTQAQLARRLNISRGAVAQWEMQRGTRPDPSRAQMLVTLLPGITWDEIYPARNDDQGRAAA